MSLSFFAPNRTVLLIADEALCIYSSGAKGVELEEIVPWESENFEQNVANVIAKDCKGRPVLILNDMVEQHYRKEKVMRSGVSMLDKKSQLKRKLNVAFPNYSVKASYVLQEKPAGMTKKTAADIYIFAALPQTDQFSKTLEAVRMSLAMIAGFCLLPVEASDMIKTLAAKVAKKSQNKARWVVFIGQHKNGGLRQIVTKNGELALTRMTPVVDDDSNIQQWASEVSQEFNATMSYLSRFGFQPDDGLHVIVISNAAAGEALHALIDEGFDYSSLSCTEAANLLNLSVGTPEDGRYADLLHAAWIGRKNRFIMPMQSGEIDDIAKPRMAAKMAAFAMVAGILFLGYQFVSQSSNMIALGSEIGEAQEKLAQLDVQYQKEVKKKEELGFDIRLVQSSIAVYSALEKENIQPLPLYRNVSRALGRDMRVDRIVVKSAEDYINLDVLPDGQPASKPPTFLSTLQMTYPSTADIDKGNEEVKNLQARLQTLLPSHKVDVTKLLKDYEYVQGIVVETGDLEKKDISQDFVAEITIKGPPEQ